MSSNNIFEEASNIYQPKKKVFVSKKVNIEKAQEEVRSMLERMDNMQKDLQEKLAFIETKGKECQIDPNLFFSQGNFFSSEEIEKFKASQAALENFDKGAQAASAMKSSKSSEKPSARRDKTRGMRKKWIPQ